MNKKYFLVILLTTLVLGGCANIPEKIAVPDSEVLIDFAAVKTEPDANVGFKARWGGVIAKIENQPERTMVEVVHFKLNRSKRPVISDETQGRFRFYYQGMLDPIIYEKGKSITVVGTIEKSEEGKIGEQKYLYPVLKAEGVHLWKKVQKLDVRVTHDPLWYDPFYYGYGYPYHNRSVIIQRSGKNSNTAVKSGKSKTK